MDEMVKGEKIRVTEKDLAEIQSNLAKRIHDWIVSVFNIS